MAISPPAHTRNEGTTDSWITPPELIERLGPFDLDPCECVPQPWPCAERSYTEQDNGLMQPWDGLVWCNPPYGKQAAAWLNKMALHNNGVALVFARTETRMFFESVWPHAAALLFLQGRLHFHYPSGDRAKVNSGGPSVLIDYGETAHQRLVAAQDLGALCVLGG